MTLIIISDSQKTICLKPGDFIILYTWQQFAWEPLFSSLNYCEVIAVVIYTDKALGKTGSANYMYNKNIKSPNDCNSLGNNYYSYGWLVFDLRYVFPTSLVIVIKFCVAWFNYWIYSWNRWTLNSFWAYLKILCFNRNLPIHLSECGFKNLKQLQ